jgi:glucokinase
MSSESEGRFWIGVDIGGTKTSVVACSHPPEMLRRIEFPTLPEQGPERAITLIKSSIHNILDECAAKSINAIGVSCGGPLDSVTGVIQAPPNLGSWVDIPITDILSSEFGTGCTLENDANAGAVAEHRFGAGRGTRHMVFLTMGTGLGAGIILDGRLFTGASGQAGEIGHVRLTLSGPVGYHKAGSVEGWASGGGIAQLAMAELAAAVERKEEPLLASSLQQPSPLTAKDVAEAALSGDPLAQNILQTAGEKLGEALAILVDILNPERIVIGGMAMRMGETLLGPAREVLHREALPGSANICQVVPASLGERIGDVAAICIATGL